jgi:uncharacterized protein (TIRG00374 family)
MAQKHINAVPGSSTAKERPIMRWNVLLGILVSAGCVLFVISQVDFHLLAVALRSTQYPLLFPVVLVLWGTLLLRAWRWRYLLEPVKSIPILSLFSVTSIGFMANMLLPARAGEVVRAYLIGEKEQVSKVASLATVIVERLLDLLSILLILFFILVFVTFPSETSLIAAGLKIGGYFSTLLCLLVGGSFWFLRSRTDQTIRLMRVCLAFLPERWLASLVEMLKAFALGLQGLNKGRHVLSVLGLSLSLWTAMALSNFLILCAFDLHLPLYAAFFFLVVQLLGVMIPASPGFIGTYHAAIIAGFTVFDVPPELALSVAIMMHATFFFPFILVGLIFLWWENLSLRDLRIPKAASCRADGP